MSYERDSDKAMGKKLSVYPQPVKLYAERDVIAQKEYYTKHVDHMTCEGLHSKSDIAAELAHRDIIIDELKSAAGMALGSLTGGMDGTWDAFDDPIEALREALNKTDARSAG